MSSILLFKGVHNRAEYRSYSIAPDNIVPLFNRIEQLNDVPIPEETSARSLNLFKVRGMCIAPVILKDQAVKFTVANVESVTGIVFDFDSCGEYDRPGVFLHWAKPAIEDIECIWWETYKSNRFGYGMRIRLFMPLLSPIGPASSIALHKVFTLRFAALGADVGTIASGQQQVGPADPTTIKLDDTSNEYGRLQAAPLKGRAWGTLQGRRLDASSMSLLITVEPKPEGQVITLPLPIRVEEEEVMEELDLTDSTEKLSEIAQQRENITTVQLIEHESGKKIATNALSMDVIKSNARSGEDKLRCKCVHTKADQAGSYSAFVHVHYGIAYVTCTSGNHGHAPGQTWPLLGLDFNYQIPPPYAVTPKGALVKQKAVARKKAATYDTISFTTPVISAVFTDDETGDEWWDIRWNNIGAIKTSNNITLRRDEIGTASKLIERAGRVGLDIHEGNKKELTRFMSDALAENQKAIPHRQMCSRMGWFKNKAGATIGCMLGNAWLAGHASAPPRELIIPTGDGRANIVHAIHSHGSVSGWVQGWNQLCVYPYAAVGIYHAIGSLLLDKIGCLPSVLEWGGTTGTGKTVSLKAAASVFGHMEDMIGGWDGTAVDLERVAAFSSALPMFKDDTKTVGKAKNSVDPEWGVYRVVSGEGRGRATPGGLDVRRKWALNLLMTGEEPVYGSGQSGGARARLISIQEYPFGLATKDAVSSLVRPIMPYFAANYGVIAPLIAAEIMTLSGEKLQAAHSKYRVKWQEAMPRHSASDRVSSHLALMEIAARLLERVIGLYADTPTFNSVVWEEHLSLLASHMCDVDRVAGVVDPIERSFGDFYSFALSYRGNFWSSNMLKQSSAEIARTPIGGWFGRWDGGEQWKEIYFTRTALMKFIRDYGYTEAPNTLAANWVKRGWLDKGTGDRQQFSIRIAGATDRCYKLSRSIVEARDKAENRGESMPEMEAGIVPDSTTFTEIEID